MASTLICVCLPEITSIEGSTSNRSPSLPTTSYCSLPDPLRYKKPPWLKQHQHQHCSNLADNYNVRHEF